MTRSRYSGGERWRWIAVMLASKAWHPCVTDADARAVDQSARGFLSWMVACVL